MSRVTQRVLAALAVATVIGAPSAADAARSYQGSDYSTNSVDRTRVYACDTEYDGNGVHADYHYLNSYGWMSYDGRVDDEDGATGGVCGKEESSRRLVYIHRAVEEVDNRPDYYGDWASYKW
ncbi:MAG: hypothetical protein ACRC0L_12790 [Angustibacter sp.]